jgi:uncharacterized protein (TIRG00374 family)
VLLRLAFGLFLIAVLFQTRLLDVGILVTALAHPALLACAVAVLSGTLLFAAARWQVLLRHVHIRAPATTTLRVVLAWAFYSTFLPGALGGDLVRSGYILRTAAGRASSGLLSILVDRVLGLTGLVLVSAIVALTRASDVAPALLLALFTLLLGLLLAWIALPRVVAALARRTRPAARSWRATAARSLREINSALTAYRRAPRPLLAALALSTGVCILDVIGLLLVMRAMGIDTLPWAQQALAGTLALLANNLPFTPGGLGIGEAAFANAAIALEPQWSGAPYATAFLVYRCIPVMATLPGAFVGIPRAPRGARDARCKG